MRHHDLLVQHRWSSLETRCTLAAHSLQAFAQASQCESRSHNLLQGLLPVLERFPRHGLDEAVSRVQLRWHHKTSAKHWWSCASCHNHAIWLAVLSMRPGKLAKLSRATKGYRWGFAEPVTPFGRNLQRADAGPDGSPPQFALQACRGCATSPSHSCRRFSVREPWKQHGQQFGRRFNKCGQTPGNATVAGSPSRTHTHTHLNGESTAEGERPASIHRCLMPNDCNKGGYRLAPEATSPNCPEGV